MILPMYRAARPCGQSPKNSAANTPLPGLNIETAPGATQHPAPMQPRLFPFGHDGAYDVSGLKPEVQLLAGTVPDRQSVLVGAAHLACAVTAGPD